MKHLMSTIYFLLLYQQNCWACPFCDIGGLDAAYFIVSIFGTLALGGGLILWAFLKSGGLKNQNQVSKKALEAEGIHESR